MGKGRKQPPFFTDDEDDTIRTEYPSCYTEDLASKLGRTANAIRRRAHRLGVKKDPLVIREQMRHKARAGWVGRKKRQKREPRAWHLSNRTPEHRKRKPCRACGRSLKSITSRERGVCALCDDSCGVRSGRKSRGN